MEGVFARLGLLAEGQHGLVTLDQLREIGVTRRILNHLITSGRLARIAPRVFVVRGVPFTWQRHIESERLSAGADAIVSHRSAAALYGLEGFDPLRTVHLTVPRDRRPRPRPDVRVHRCLDYELIQPATRQRIPVTDVARLVLDLYACEPNPEVARRGLFSARKKRLVTWTELYGCLDAHARQGRRGVTFLRADLDLYSRIGCPETTFEDAIRKLLMDAGLPEPELQHRACGGQYRIDVAYPEWKIGIEGRSKAHHLTDEAFEADPVRDADLAIDGWIIIHVTWAQIRDDPAEVIRRVRRALSRRGGVAA